MYNVGVKHLRSNVLERRVIHQQVGFACKWAFPFPTLSLKAYYPKPNHIFQRGCGGSPHILSKDKQQEPVGGLSSTQLPAQP